MPQTIATRLARICSYSSQAPEWEQFVRLITPEVSLAVRRVSEVWGDGSVSTVNELVQDVFLKLCENERRVLREFEDRGGDSFLKLMRMVSASVATDYFRRAQAEKRGGRAPVLRGEMQRLSEEVRDAGATEAVQRPTLIAQLDGLLRMNPAAVTERDRNLFWLHYQQGLTADAISRIPAIGLSQKGVESAISRLTKLLRDSITSGKSKQGFLKENPEKSSNSKGISPAITIHRVEE